MTACLSADVQVSCREQGVQAGDRESQEFTVQEAKDDTRNTCIPKDIKEHPSVISLDDHPETKAHRKQYCTVPDIAEDQPKEDGEYDRDNEGGIELVVLRPGIHIDQELAWLHKIDVMVLHGREILSLLDRQLRDICLAPRCSCDPLYKAFKRFGRDPAFRYKRMVCCCKPERDLRFFCLDGKELVTGYKELGVLGFQSVDLARYLFDILLVGFQLHIVHADPFPGRPLLIGNRNSLELGIEQFSLHFLTVLGRNCCDKEIAFLGFGIVYFARNPEVNLLCDGAGKEGKRPVPVKQGEIGSQICEGGQRLDLLLGLLHMVLDRCLPGEERLHLVFDPGKLLFDRCTQFRSPDPCLGIQVICPQGECPGNRPESEQFLGDISGTFQGIPYPIPGILFLVILHKVFDVKKPVAMKLRDNGIQRILRARDKDLAHLFRGEHAGSP